MRQTLPISVVVPVYNRAALLREALASVANQGCIPQEVIVVDDGSTDNVAEVAEEFGARLIRQQNSGASAARNAGIAAATSPWVAFLDSDDVWLPDKLTLQWGAVQAAPQLGFVFTDLHWFGDGAVPHTEDASGNVLLHAMHKNVIAPDAAILDNAELLRAVCRSNIVQISGILIRTELARSVTFDNGLRYCEDHDFTLRAIGRTTVGVITKVTLLYRYHPDSLSNNECALALGGLDLSHRVLSQPYRYPAPIPDEFRARLWYLHRRAGAALLRAGMMRQARRHLISSIKRHPTTIAFAGLAATFVPRWVVTKSGRARLAA